MQHPIVLLADIHANIEALNAVLDHITELSTHRIVCLGDIVGYGPDPGRCLSELQKRNASIIAGNHDAAVCGQISPKRFNKMARASTHWTQKNLSKEQLELLRNLPHSLKIEELYGVHGTPEDPLMEYLLHPEQARRAYQVINLNLLAVAHTHEPALFREREDNHFQKISISEDTSISWNPGESQNFVINPGSVGQPRDGDPRASFAVIAPGSREIRWKRIEYPVDTVRRKISSTELPRALAQRLVHGR